jgi:glycosyltransferase EpsE
MKKGVKMTSISVIMGVYNGENSVQRAIDSIVQQSFKDWEFIICDDASCDETYRVLDLYATDDRIKIIRNDQNLGLAASLNKCIENSSAKYLVRQDADDYSYPNRLQVLYDAIKASDEVAVIGSNADLFGADGGVWGEYLLDDPVEKNWVKRNQIIHATTIMDKFQILTVNGYDSKAGRMEDYDLWVRLVANGGKIAKIKESLYAVHWDIKDYSRRKMKYRFCEIVISFRAFLLPACPWYYLPFVIKPIVVGCIPNVFLFMIHRNRFRVRKNGT